MNIRQTEELIDQLIGLEYTIRQSIAVRDDQEENADPQQLEAARQYGVGIHAEMTKGDLLNAVQTTLRALQARTTSSGKGPIP